ncbi:outer membrane beta-barrel protein [Nibribacter ruber]|uniref:Outer membrane beta-barrel protein n=1 Tax=Nibribacter ruber TaxID=2698458 RepID=A0A6P1P291_9BACT|nr:outer membrane beta-barrel protein [Nibribacter ruber]QHL88514.1 outer membrane beta-barrel protein [Nibribacter ruber]
MLKKSFFACAFSLIAAFSASAQDVTVTSASTAGGGIKPTTGEITGEVQLSLTDGSTVGLNQLRGRYFLSPSTALRLSFALDAYNDTNDDETRSTTLVSLSPGIEKHFAGTDRLSPYIGAELRLSKFFASYEDDNFEVEGGWGTGTNRNYFGLGLGAVAGADYYFAKHVYLGVEFGYGLTYRTYGEVEINPKNGASFTVDDDQNSLTLGSSVNGGLRLGFVF